MTYYALLSSIFIYAALGTADIQSSQGDLQLTDNSTQLTLEYRLRLLEETLLVNGMTEGDSVEKRLLQLERTLLAANVRVNQLELKLRRATTLPIAKDSSSDDTQEKPAAQPSGVSFIRWGRTQCNDNNQNATTIYRGYMAGAAYNVDGGGANHLCLHEHPQWGYHKAGFQKYGGLIYGTESENYDSADFIDPFSTSNSEGRSIVNNPLPCAACFVPHRSTWMMIPARRECPDGWTLEYGGYVHSEANGVGRQKTSYECIDEAPEVALGDTNQDQTVIYAVQVKCGTLPCSAFMDGWELSCVVCTR